HHHGGPGGRIRLYRQTVHQGDARGEAHQDPRQDGGRLRNLMSEQQEAGLDCDPAEVYRSIGTLTRTVHEGLRQLGLDRAIEGAVASLPDARDRLNYIARISGEAAEKVIGQVEGAKAEQASLAAEAERIRRRLVDDPVAAVASGELMNFV